MIKAVLFDLDGVIVDSETISREASDTVLSEVGIHQTEEERKRVFGRRTIDNYRDAIKARNLDLDPGELVEKKNRVFADLIRGRLDPLPGVLDLIGKLKDDRVKVAVVSSSPLDRVNASLEEVGLLLEFELILSGDCCEKGKPDPEPFLLAAEQLGVEPGECVVIEDAEAGIRAGKAAGMKVLAVRSPNTHGQDLGLADLVVDSLEEVDGEVLERL
ncbi:MAG: HAD-IA family hydrolase [Candidatus Altiarchaeales archaeon]|nr:HAD-IA family hydrolase [Candidatus Altiarchaeales archaeon]MBD3415679.1 HAD-IA family hydrolase [Candidatus Altiarchaeales archaeon]